MLLQDSPKQSDLAPEPELEPQSHQPAESDPGCCEYRACLRSCRRDIPLPVTQSPCFEVEHREAEAGQGVVVQRQQASSSPAVNKTSVCLWAASCFLQVSLCKHFLSV